MGQTKSDWPKAGDLVTIYEDPITQRKPEGKAKILGKVPGWHEGNPRYWVRFPGEMLKVERLIYSPLSN
jgi:hypothetical protein